MTACISEIDRNALQIADFEQLDLGSCECGVCSCELPGSTDQRKCCCGCN